MMAQQGVSIGQQGKLIAELKEENIELKEGNIPCCQLVQLLMMSESVSEKMTRKASNVVISMN